MKQSKSIEEQVAELTEQQKRTILNIDRYGMVILLVLTVPGLLMMCVGLLFAITTAGAMTPKTLRSFQLIGGVIVLISMAILVFIRVRYPYYSDKKAAYLRKTSNAKNKT